MSNRNPETMREEIARDMLGILGRGPGTFNILPLPQDASMRRYYRISGSALAGPKIEGQTLVLMVLANPNPFSKPEEITTGGTSSPRSSPSEDDLDYVNVLKHFQSIGIPVPKLYHYNMDSGLLYLEDLGDRLLEDFVKGLSDAQIAPYYEKAIDIMFTLHENGTRLSGNNFVGLRRGFDEKLLFYELKHYVEYGIEARKGLKVRADDLKVIEKHMRQISVELAAEPRVLVHRDFQSRNIMLQGERLRLIDFQDALLGTRQYDLVSLLRDSYVVLSSQLVSQLLAYYTGKLEKAGIKVDRERFQRVFDLQTLQRKIKDAGRFDYIDIVKKNPKFLKYIPDTLGYVREAFGRLPEHKPLQDKLAKYTPKLQE